MEAIAIRQLEQEVETIGLYLQSVKEGEETWLFIETSLQKLGGLTREQGLSDYDFGGLVIRIKFALENSVLTDRTKLSGTALEVLAGLAELLGKRFNPHLDFFVPVVMRLFARTNKLYVTRSQSCLSRILKKSQDVGVLKLLLAGLSHQNKAFRYNSLQLLRQVLENWDLMLLEAVGLNSWEDGFKCTLEDSAAEVRDLGRKTISDVYFVRFPVQKEAFLNSISAQSRKYLDPPVAASSKRIPVKAVIAKKIKSQPIPVMPEIEILEAPPRPAVRMLAKKASKPEIGSNETIVGAIKVPCPSKSFRAFAPSNRDNLIEPVVEKAKTVVTKRQVVPSVVPVVKKVEVEKAPVKREEGRRRSERLSEKRTIQSVGTEEFTIAQMEDVLVNRNNTSVRALLNRRKKSSLQKMLGKAVRSAKTDDSVISKKRTRQEQPPREPRREQPLEAQEREPQTKRAKKSEESSSRLYQPTQSSLARQRKPLKK